MVKSLVALAALLAGCTVGNSPRMNFDGASNSTKSVDEITGCLALHFSQEKRSKLTVADIEHGKRLSVSIPVSGMNFIQRTADIIDGGRLRLVTVHSLLAKTAAGSPVAAPYAACL